MSAPENPYARTPGIESDNAADLFTLGREEPVPEGTGLSGVDLHNIAIRNYRLGRREAEAAARVEHRQLLADRATAWDEGQQAGSSYADERAQLQVEAILRLIAAKLEPQKGVSDAQARRAAHQLVRGALVVLTDPEGESDGLGVSGFEALENALKDAARVEDTSEQEGVDDGR